MAEGIKNKVAIVGMGCTPFGEHFDRSAESLMVEAFQEALEDAGIETTIRFRMGRGICAACGQLGTGQTEQEGTR